MVCVERVSEYSQLESEADLQTETDEDISLWPISGSIKVQNLSIRYRKTLPLSLKGVTFDVPCGKRIGVVGRTGSGE
jgi:ABC-type multidrug transport system fused ATPase/permease subunit